MVIRTVGHGTVRADAFTKLLLEARIEMVVDVRRFPASRRQPHLGADEMARWLADAGVGHRWIEALGGRRRVGPDSPNRGLTNEQFRAYADHMATDEFRAGVTELCSLAGQGAVAVMCAESVWWRCHRRLLADHLVLVERTDVEHLFHDGRLAPHPAMDEARVLGDHLVYDRVTA